MYNIETKKLGFKFEVDRDISLRKGYMYLVGSPKGLYCIHQKGERSWVSVNIDLNTRLDNTVLLNGNKMTILRLTLDVLGSESKVMKIAESDKATYRKFVTEYMFNCTIGENNYSIGKE